MKKNGIVVLLIFIFAIIVPCIYSQEPQTIPQNGVITAPDEEWVCLPWSDCVRDVKTKNCYSPYLNKYMNITENCSRTECSNDILDSSETDMDCGGKCKPCEDGKRCITDYDCYNLCGPDKTCFSVKISENNKVEKIKDNKNEPVLLEPGKYDMTSLSYLIIILFCIFGLILACYAFTHQKTKPIKTIMQKIDRKSEIKNLVHEAEFLIDDNKKLEAMHIYKRITQLYSKLSPLDKREVHHLIIDLNYRFLPGYGDLDDIPEI